MLLAPWRSPLSRALHRNRSQPYSRYLQLATVDFQGLPANRTVVFRGFLENSNQLQIITDARSNKIAHIQAKPWAEICWYFSKSREQFRLFGKLILVTAADLEPTLQLARQRVWQNLSDSARLQFSWPNPGEKRTENLEAFSSSDISAKEPVNNFCLLLLTPEKVDHLELKGEPQNRCLYLLQQDQTWSTQPINP